MGSLANLQSRVRRAAVRATAYAAALLCAFLLAPTASAQSVNRYTNNTASAVNAITDTATPCSNPLKRTFVVGTSYTVSDVNIGVLLSHTYRGDLVMTLVSPAGTRVAFANRIGGQADNFNALIDDAAGSAISGYTANDTITAVPPYNNSFSPSSALSAFNGQGAIGTWTLEVCDAAAQDSGTFQQADLYLTEAPTSYADLSLSQSVSSATPNDLASISYTLTVTNSSASNLTSTGIVVRDVLPIGSNFVSASGSGTYSSATGDWSVGTLAPGQSATLIINATVAAGNGVTVTNTAEVTASSVADIDSILNNGLAGEDDYAAAAFTVAVSRSAGIAPTLTCSAGSAIFDWDAQAWTAGATSNSYTLTGIGTVGFAITNSNGAFLSNATYGGQSPAKQNTVTGGLATPQQSLEQLVDLTSPSATVNTTISLGSAANGLQFTIFDVDFNANQFADKVTVTGSVGGIPVSPTLTNGTANFVSGNSAYGDAISSDTQSNGNVVVTFAGPVDTITIAYGNHSYAPADPGQQGIALHDFTFCKAVPGISVTKVSSLISDPFNGTTNPKAIPGAVMEYCILISNTGSATLTSISASDPLPAKFTYAAGTMTSGSTCAGATTSEDDNSTGSDESDPYGASISGTTITGTAASLTAGGAFALKFRGTVN